VRAREERLQALAERQRALAGERAAVEPDLQELRARAEDAERLRAARRTERDGADTRRREHEATAQRRADEARSAETDLERARHALAAAREHEEALRVEGRAADDALAALVARAAALERLEREREGLAPAARRLLEARDQFGDGAVLGPLSDFLRTSQTEAPLMERLFGEWLHAVLVRDEALDAVRAWHEREQPGSLVLLPTSGPRGQVDDHDDDLVVAEGPAAGWARVLLRGQEVLGPVGCAIRRPNGAVVLAGEAEGTGPLARRAELVALGGEIAEHRRAVQRLHAAQALAAEAHAAADAALGAALRQAETARAAARDAAGAADDARRVLQRLERESVEADDAAIRLAERVTQRGDRLAALTHELHDAERDRAQVEHEVSARRAALAELEAQQDAARERRVHWQVEEAQVSAREAAAREREDRARTEHGAAQHDAEALERELHEIDRDSGTLAERRQQWLDALAERRVTAQELATAATQAERDMASAEDRLTAAEAALDAARTALTDASERGHKIELARTEMEGHRRALVERIEAEWHRPLAELLAGASEVDGDLDALRAEAAHLTETLDALGPVNPLAVEEHAEEQKRLEFLTTQRDDLVEGRDILFGALREIEQTARGLFAETFVAIRRNFQAVFQTLFDGGECDVRLANEDDPLGSDIEIAAAPRGKRTQRIHLLSSGERALVAISLLFAIYLTKPSPFCLLDEVDAPLDDANVVRFIRLLDEFKRDTQFIVITHNPRTMQVADAVYGVTMQEPGVSTIVGVRLGEMETV
jgi:chromosome segregation protein